MRVTHTTLRRLIREAVLAEMGWGGDEDIYDAELPDMGGDLLGGGDISGPSLGDIEDWLGGAYVKPARLAAALQMWIDEIKPGGVVFLNADGTVELDGMLLTKDDIANIFLG